MIKKKTIMIMVKYSKEQPHVLNYRLLNWDRHIQNVAGKTSFNLPVQVACTLYVGMLLLVTCSFTKVSIHTGFYKL